MPADAVTGFAAIRGHERVQAFLRAAVAQERLPHALLFAGPDGVGKRSVAVAMAAWILCEGAGDDACGRCASCRQVAAGSHPDLLLVTAAAGKKEIGVDRARDIKRFAQLRPLRATLKIAIVDDAHKLTVAAQNALLKTLEEPPGHSILILVANNADALLATVRSRCQRVQFAPLPDQDVRDILTTAHGVDASAAGALATRAEGSPGRALALSGYLGGTSIQDLLPQLAELQSARYVQLMQWADALAHPEGAADVKLELLMFTYRDDAFRSLGAEHLVRDTVSTSPLVPQLPARRALHGAQTVHEARAALVRGNPNRQMLLEALLLRLARV